MSDSESEREESARSARTIPLSHDTYPSAENSMADGTQI